MTQASSAIIVSIEPLDGICQAVHEYALGQRPLFGNAGRLPGTRAGETRLVRLARAGQVAEDMYAARM